MPIGFESCFGALVVDHVTFCVEPIFHTVPVTGDKIVGSNTSRGAGSSGAADTSRAVRLKSSPEKKSRTTWRDLGYIFWTLIRTENRRRSRYNLLSNLEKERPVIVSVY